VDLDYRFWRFQALAVSNRCARERIGRLLAMVALVRRQVSRHNISQFQEIFEIGGLMEKFIGTKYSGKFAVRWFVGRTNNYDVNVGTGRCMRNWRKKCFECSSGKFRSSSTRTGQGSSLLASADRNSSAWPSVSITDKSTCNPRECSASLTKITSSGLSSTSTT